jgi:sulfatase maturation enzyme AslB (radical SAM superfamily)
MYTAEQMRKDAREGKFIIMVISVTGECNLHCEFCAYDTIKRHKKMSYTTLNNIFDEIDRCPEEQNFLICWSGGEPTFDIDHLLKCQQELLKRNYRPDKIKQAMMTNCWWANNEEVIDKIRSMHLDIIGVSASECHIKEVPRHNMAKIIDMFEGTETTVWSYFNGKCMDLYPEAAEKTLKENMFAHTTRHPNWSIHDLIANYNTVEPYDFTVKKDPCGFYIHPDGMIGSCCSEEGNRPCILGNVNTEGDLLKAIHKLANAKRRNITIKNCTIEYNSDFHHHACRFCKQAGINASCFVDSDEQFEIDFKDLVNRTPKELQSHKKY